MGILSVIGKGLAKKTSKNASEEVSKRGGEVMGRKSEKFMGMAEEVQPKRLSSSASEEVSKRGGSGKAIAAGAAVAGAAGAAALSSRDKEETKASTRSEGKGRSAQEERPTRDAGRVSASSDSEDTKASSKPSSFGAAFKAARTEGKDVFTYEGKKYTTEMAGEKKAAPKAEVAEKPAAKETGVREGRNENIEDETRKRAMESVANLAKGGMIVNKGIGASMKPHNLFGKKK